MSRRKKDLNRLFHKSEIPRTPSMVFPSTNIGKGQRTIKSRKSINLIMPLSPPKPKKSFDCKRGSMIKLNNKNDTSENSLGSSQKLEYLKNKLMLIQQENIKLSSVLNKKDKIQRKLNEAKKENQLLKKHINYADAGEWPTQFKEFFDTFKKFISNKK